MSKQQIYKMVVTITTAIVTKTVETYDASKKL